jgi:DNA-binding NarL/FixJ family response regulator
MITTFIVDDHPSVLHGLKGILNASSDIEVIGEALNGAILLEKLKIKQPDLILMDLVMEDMNGIEATKAVKKLYPAIKILIFTTHLKLEDVRKTIELGVEGYLIKDVKNKDLIAIIKDIMDGNHYYDERGIELLMNAPPKPPQKPKAISLTQKEKEVALLIVTGKSVKEIAAELHRSPSTIDTHRKNIYAKLGIHKSVELVEYVRSVGWLK